MRKYAITIGFALLVVSILVLVFYPYAWRLCRALAGFIMGLTCVHIYVINQMYVTRRRLLLLAYLAVFAFVIHLAEHVSRNAPLYNLAFRAEVISVCRSLNHGGPRIDYITENGEKGGIEPSEAYENVISLMPGSKMIKLKNHSTVEIDHRVYKLASYRWIDRMKGGRE